MAQTGLGHEVFSSNDAAPRHTPGELFEIVNSTGLKRYKYVKYDNGTANLTLANGNLVYFLDSSDFNGYLVTKDESDTQATLVTGVAINAITDGYYGFVQTWGYHSAISTNGDDDITAGSAIVPSASGDGTADSTAEGTAPVRKVVAWAVEADVDAADTVAGYICLE